MLISDQILLKLECGVDEYLYLPCIETKHTKANGKRVLKRLFNYEYALQLQSMNPICCRYVRQSMRLLVLFAILKAIFIMKDRLN